MVEKVADQTTPPWALELLSRTALLPHTLAASDAASQRIHTAGWIHKFADMGAVSNNVGGRILDIGLSPNHPRRRLYAGFRYAPSLTNNVAVCANVLFKYQGNTVLRVPIDTRINTFNAAGSALIARLSLSFDYMASGVGVITPAAGEMSENLLFVQGPGAADYFGFAPHHVDVTADSVEIVVDRYTPTVDTGFYAFALLGVYSDAGA